MLLNPYRFFSASGGAPGEAHRYWRINSIVTDGGYFQISEMRLFSGATDVTATATKTASDALLAGTLAELFDNNLTNQPTWSEAVAEAAGFYIQFDFGTPTTVDGVKQAGCDNPYRYMAGFRLQYSDDGSAWTTLGTKSGLTYPGNFTLSELYSFGGGGAALYWRITGVDTPGSYVQISELQFFEDWVNVTSGATVTASNSVYNGAVANLTNGNLTDFVTWESGVAEAPTFWIRFAFAVARRINSIRQAPNQSPLFMQGFTLQYSDDNVIWTTLGAKSALPYPGDHVLSEPYVFGPVPPVAAFSGTPLAGAVPLSVTFTDTSAYAPTSWAWAKNNGTGWVPFAGTPNAQHPVETFAAGTWDVRLTATNALGSDDEVKTGYINPPSYRYWRIKDILVASGSRLTLVELQALENGVDVTAAATKTFSNTVQGGATANLFDGVMNSGNFCVWDNSQASTFWIKFDFGGSPKTINGIRAARHATASEYWNAFTLQYSSDNAAWTTLGSKSGITLSTPYTLSEIYTFP